MTQLMERIKFLEGVIAAYKVPKDQMEDEWTISLAKDDKDREVRYTGRQLRGLVGSLDEFIHEPTDTVRTILSHEADKATLVEEACHANGDYRRGRERGLCERIGCKPNLEAAQAEYALKMCEYSASLIQKASLENTDRQLLNEAARTIRRAADGLVE